MQGFKQPEIEYIASILFDTLSINQTDSRDVLLEKYKALASFRSFLMKHIHFDMLPDKKSKLQYAEFANKLNQQIEELEAKMASTSEFPSHIFQSGGELDNEELKRIGTDKHFSAVTEFQHQGRLE